VSVWTSNCVVSCFNLIQYYLFFYHSQCLLYCLISTVNVTDCTVLTPCDGQLAMPASNFRLCGYVLEYYSALSLCLSQLRFVLLPYIYYYFNSNKLHIQQFLMMLYCYISFFSYILPSTHKMLHRTVVNSFKLTTN
jgi:hypothetical protein